MRRGAVREFESAGAGNFLLWQDLTLTQADEEFPEGPIYFRDTTGGSQTLLGSDSLAFSGGALYSVDSGALGLNLGYINREPLRIFRLPGLEFIDVPGDWSLIAPVDGDRWLSGAAFGGAPYGLLDLKTGSTTRLYAREGLLRRHDEESLTVLEVPRCCNDGSEFDVGPVWRVPLDGSQARDPWAAARRSRVRPSWASSRTTPRPITSLPALDLARSRRGGG